MGERAWQPRVVVDNDPLPAGPIRVTERTLPLQLPKLLRRFGKDVLPEDRQGSFDGYRTLYSRATTDWIIEQVNNSQQLLEVIASDPAQVSEITIHVIALVAVLEERLEKAT